MIGFIFMIDSMGDSEKNFFENLYKKYNRLMFSTAARYCDNPCDYEDIVQEALVNLYYKIELLQALPHYALSTYICFTVKNVAINHYRHQTVVAKHVLAFDDNEINAQNITPQDYVLLSELKTDFAKIWARLPEQDQELLYRKYIFGQNNAELAEVFHCKKENIRMRLSRARKKAASLIKEEGIYEQS